ncbi:MAG: hypothetical protein JRI68_32775 [Deltaproteobacteria bacterium]|nr:hypothetical protein [Deltaproteobacteria bacterium]
MWSSSRPVCKAGTGWAALWLATTLAGEATAWHDNPDQPQITDQNAYTLPAGQHKLGVLGVDYGIVDEFQIGTSFLAWSLLIPNATAEWRFAETSKFAFSGAVGAAYASTRPYTIAFEDWPVADLGIFPFELIGTFRMHQDWTWSVGAQFTTVLLSGEYDKNDFEGAAAVSNLQGHSTIEWRVNRRAALLLHGRYLVFQTVRAGATVTLEPDEYTTITASAAGESDLLNFPHAYQIIPAVQLSWDTVNLRLGVGYGNIIIPAINFVLPKRSLVPQLDLYWRF